MPTLTRVRDGLKFFRNNPPPIAGLNKPSWRKLTGKYYLDGYGPTPTEYYINIQNGYLYIDDIYLREVDADKFQSANGEVLEKTAAGIKWKNYHLHGKKL
jgi:hypothetical protein